MIANISPQALHDRRKKGESIDLLDVRTPVEFREVHVEEAWNIPLDQLQPQKVQAARRHIGQPLFVICRTGRRSLQACEQLQATGIEVVNVEGGTVACEAAGHPVTRGAKAMSLERQVRIAAGGLVLLGVILSFTVHPYAIGLSAFVGAGLMFAGITDTCGMGMILARMPWNKLSSTNSATGVK